MTIVDKMCVYSAIEKFIKTKGKNHQITFNEIIQDLADDKV